MNEILTRIDGVVNAISGVLYMPWVPMFLIVAGLFFTFRTKLIQIRLLPESLRVVMEKPKTSGGISSFGALMVSTASRVGTGNIVGVSTAICLGGYGAVFWMWITAILGGASAFIESTLAQVYKRKDKKGHSYGGPSYYMESALGQRWLGVIFAVIIILTYAVGYNMLASYNLQSAFAGFSFYGDHTAFVIGLILAILFAICVLGGAHRLTKVTGALVPIMGRHRQESVQEYAAEEVLNAIHFIEEQTGEKFDWDAFFKSMERFNAETDEFLEWMEISKTDYPQVMGVTLALYRYGVYQAAGGRNQAFLDMDKKLTRMAMEGYDKKQLAAKEYRHRAMTWGVQAAYYTALPIWLLNCWGVVTIADMLSMVSTEKVNTKDKHQAMLDLAYLYENMIMRNRSNGGYETGVEALWRFCEMFRIDIVIMYVHMGCKSMSGYHGLFEEEARKHGVHLIWVTHNLMCPEDGSRRDMRTEINRYMRTVFREEPLDPTLEDFDDKQNW